ncbi:MAG: FHA domain-containing protein [Chloroflexi bacterium]|nr:FHA domain-containing protein [Chloroflexota bacterium]
MVSRSDDHIRKVTSELSAEMLGDLFVAKDEIVYQSVPHADFAGRPAWRVRFEPTFSSNHTVGLDINGEVILGRNMDGPEYVTLFSAEESEKLGVSRRHALLRPTDTKLYIVDLNSTNGTWINGHSIGVNTPYALTNGDRLVLGRMECIVNIVKRPTGHTAALHSKADLADILPTIARAITAQLNLEEVLKQAMDMVMTYTQTDEVSVWLVDDQTGELFLEAGRGLNDEQLNRLSVSDSLAGKVMETGKPVHANRSDQGSQIKVKTGYLVEAVIYVPLALGGVTFGVLSAAHRKAGKTFNSRDEKLMMAIADFTAIAIQNARTYEATNHALTRRIKIVTALNYALSYDLKAALNPVIGYAGLLVDADTLDDDSRDMANQISEAGRYLAHLLEKLTEITRLCENPSMPQAPLDLVEVVSRGVYDLQPAADAKGITLDFQVMGEACIIQGNAPYLYRSVFNLVDNAVKYSPPGAVVSTALVFGYNDIIIRVRDTGPGIPQADLPYLFDKYFRSKPSGGEDGGLGLGLELVRTTVEAHRGTISVRNGDDQGAEFVITLPNTLRIE